MSKPQGGFVAWIQLPKQVSVPKLYAEARNKGISISPGDIFSSSNKYQSSIRLTYSNSWTAERIAAIKILGELANNQIEKN